MEEKIEMAKEAVGLAAWERRSEEERAKLVAMEVWRPEVRSKWLADTTDERRATEDEGEESGADAKSKSAKKSGKTSGKESEKRGAKKTN
jgi:hypothetical protein